VRIFIATVHLVKPPGHDYGIQEQGKCPFSENCSDITGGYHSFLVGAHDEADANAQIELAHGKLELVRLEEVEGVDHEHERDHTACLPPGKYEVSMEFGGAPVLFYEVCVCGARRLFGNHPHGEWIETTP
jgi:hypothetical protein